MIKLKNYLDIAETILKVNGVNEDSINIENVQSIVEEISFDIKQNNEVTRPRILQMIESLFGIDSKQAHTISSSIAKYMKDKKILEGFDYIPSEDFDDTGFDDISDEMLDDIMGGLFGGDDQEYFDDRDLIDESTKARAPRLTGKAEKNRVAKSSVMGKVKKDPKYIDAAKHFRLIVKNLVREYARQSGIAPARVNLTNLKA